MMTRTENNLDNEMEAGFPKRLRGAICNLLVLDSLYT